MDRRTTTKSIGFAWHRGRVRNQNRGSGDEYYGNPSPLARQTFNHVLAIGKSRCQPQYVMKRQRGVIGYVLHYVNRGQFWHRIGGREFRVDEGGACLLDCSKPFAQGNDQPATTDLWWMSFHGPEVPRLVAELGVDRNPVFEHLPRDRFQSLFRQLWTVTVHKPVAHEARCHALLAAILAELFVARARQADMARQLGHEPKLSERMHAAIDFMSRYGSGRIGLKEIADRVGLNLHHFARRFRREVGMAPIQYLSRLRIEQAKQLLATTDKPVAEVGRLVGIADPGYFARLFRKLTGVSPQAYRAQKRPRR